MENNQMPKIDELVKRNIINQLVRDDRIDASRISVEVRKGVVTLKGEVPTYFSRSSAFEDTIGIQGVREVKNQLIVNYPSTATIPSDLEIESRIRHKVAVNPDIAMNDLEVMVSAGQVTLRGTVDAYWKRRHLEYLASTEPGVASIENHLAVVPTGDFLDKTIAEDIVDSLESKALVDADDIHVSVRDGGVRLTGKVPNGMARYAAAEAAYYTSGVTNVDNRIEVSGTDEQ